VSRERPGPPPDPQPGPPPDPQPGPGPDGDPDPGRHEADAAAASALARARKGARDKGLRPGMKPGRPRGRGRRDATLSGSGRDGRDPALLGEQLDRLLVDRGWQVDIAVGSVLGRWPSIVGQDVSAHVVPVAFTAGTLTVRADSTAWATQMRLMAGMVLGRLEAEVGAGTVTELTVLGPVAPSWSRGLRRARGPGPRDTYG